MASTFGDCSYLMRVDSGPGGNVARYTISFYRQRGDWYDQMRYDSHEQKRGQSILAPHFHMKIRSEFKADTGKAVAEIKEIIENQLRTIAGVLER